MSGRISDERLKELVSYVELGPWGSHALCPKTYESYSAFVELQQARKELLALRAELEIVRQQRNMSEDAIRNGSPDPFHLAPKLQMAQEELEALRTSHAELRGALALSAPWIKKYGSPTQRRIVEAALENARKVTE